MSSTYTQSFLVQLLTATHDFSTDTIKCALMDGSVAQSSATTVYSTSGEVASGSGYTTGGATVTISSGFPEYEGGGAARFEDISWTFSGSKTVRYALIYNASKSNKAILVIDLGSAAYSGTFTINFPLTVRPTILLAGAA